MKSFEYEFTNLSLGDKNIQVRRVDKDFDSLDSQFKNFLLNGLPPELDGIILLTANAQVYTTPDDLLKIYSQWDKLPEQFEKTTFSYPAL